MELLAARGITKYFGDTGTLANDRVDITLSEGETRAIIGENGAGKSTLARIIAGLTRADSGEVLMRGSRLKSGSVHEAESAGIGFVPQVSLLAPGLTVAENIALGREPRALGFLLSRRKAYVEAALLIERFGFRLDPEAIVGSLTAAERRQVEIARALARGGELLILDEPTSILSESESERMFELLARLAKAGKGLVLVTHRISEVMKAADSITVLRQGSVVAEGRKASFDEDALARLMARPTAAGPRLEARAAQRESAKRGIDSPPVLEVRGAVLVRGAKPVSLAVRSGEVLGVAALAGNGLGRLEDIASGMSRSRGASVLVAGESIAAIPREELRHRRLAYLPSDREGRGLCLSVSVRDNILALKRSEFGFLDWIGSRRRNKAATEEGSTLGLEADPRALASSLSGGNRQRLALARELGGRRSALVLAEPLQSLDLGSQAETVDIIRRLAAEGAAILLLDSSVETLVAIADRVAALYRGEIAFEGMNQGAETATALLAAMTGTRSGTAA